MQRWKFVFISVISMLILLACSESAKVNTTVTSVSKTPPASRVATKAIVTSTATPGETKLSPAQKAQVVTLITNTTNHFTQIWIDGQIALGTQPYPNADAGLAAFDDPTSAASLFRDWRKSEDPALAISSLLDTFNKADALYTGSIPDDALLTWRDDVSQLTTDMEVWVTDGASWQISATPTATMTHDAQTITNDFTTIHKDIQAIS